MATDAPTRIALIEMTSGIDPQRNLAVIENAVARAAESGAKMAFLPEMSVLLDRDRARSSLHITAEEDSPWPAMLQETAKSNGIWLHSGSAPFLSVDGLQRVNRSHLIAADGSIRARYDKIHMFDVELPTGENWSESSAYAGGSSLTVIDTPIGKIGLSICFDLRFPELYRALTELGATCFVIPAAFTVPTGMAHWHILLRARAIECAAYVLAPAQVGQHADGRATFGHSLVASPWGEICAESQRADDPNAENGVVILAEINPSQVKSARRAIPLARSRKMRALDL